jgi:hypothetical protein
MRSDINIHVDAIAALERSARQRSMRLSIEERGDLLAAACSAAAKVEASRRAMGFPPAEPAPWPESTRAHLKEWTRRARQQ